MPIFIGSKEDIKDLQALLKESGREGRREGGREGGREEESGMK